MSNFILDPNTKEKNDKASLNETLTKMALDKTNCLDDLKSTRKDALKMLAMLIKKKVTNNNTKTVSALNLTTDNSVIFSFIYKNSMIPIEKPTTLMSLYQ